jgi:hypothetical protein
MTVVFMFAAVTHFGDRRTDFTAAFAVLSSTVLFTSPDGGVWPART